MIQTRKPLMLIKGNEKYIVVYNTGTQTQALRQLGRWASNAQLSFTWYDAMVLSQYVRNRRI